MYVDGILDEDKTNELMWMVTNQSMKQTGMELTHLVGEFVLVNDIYRLATGKDWLSGEKSNRIEAAGWLGLTLLPFSKLTNIVKELKAGNKLLKGVQLSAEELKILNDAGYFDKVVKVENVDKVGKVKIPERPSWKQSEIDAEMNFPGYDSQKSFLNGKEVPYGTKGSTRPELYKTGHSVEVKNYNIQNNSGKNNLINNVSKQIKDRVANLPSGTEQTILIDVRGQNVTNELLKEVRSKILKKSGVDVEIIFKR